MASVRRAFDWTLNIPTLIALAGVVWGASRIHTKVEVAEERIRHTETRVENLTAANAQEHQAIREKIAKLP